MREHSRSDAMLRAFEANPYLDRYELFRKVFYCRSYQEHELDARFRKRIDSLSPWVSDLAAMAHKVQQQQLKLWYATRDIRDATEQDRGRLNTLKRISMSQWDVKVRFAVQMFPMSEPAEVAGVNRNLALARMVHKWSTEVLDWLNFVEPHVRLAKTKIDLLTGMMQRGEVIKWTSRERPQELSEFVERVEQGAALLQNNTLAWEQLKAQGLI